VQEWRRPVVGGQGMEGGGTMQGARPCTLVMLGLMALGGCAVAHTAAGEKLRVGISPCAPCVMGTAKGPEGVAIDAWQVIARTWADAPGWSGTISTYGSC